ncbi:MAG: hypothetical protein ABID45_03960 [Patescibacteria group bacterium]
MKKKNIIFSSIVSVFMLCLAFSASAGSVTDITLDGDMSDWDDVSYLIQEEALISFTDSYATGNTYYWNNDTDAWQTEAIEEACMYNEATPLKLTGYKLANNTNYIYFYWERNTDWMNYFWLVPGTEDMRDEQSFDDDPVDLTNPVIISDPPCLGESLYNPANYDHDMVFSFDTNLDGEYDYYMVQNVIAPQGSAGQGYSYTVNTYIYQDNGDGTYDGQETETLVEDLGNDYEQFPDETNTCPYGVCQEGRIDKSKFFDDLDLQWGDTVQVRYEAYSDRLWRTSANLYTFNRHNNLRFQLNTPTNKKKISKKKVTVSGTVKKGSRITVLVNGHRKARFTTSKKSFSKKVKIKQGWNYVVVKAKKGSNKVTRAKKVKRN